MQSAEIAPRIHRIACMFDETRVIYCHLLLGRSKSLLIDTGMSYTPERDILRDSDSSIDTGWAELCVLVAMAWRGIWIAR